MSLSLSDWPNLPIRDEGSDCTIEFLDEMSNRDGCWNEIESFMKSPESNGADLLLLMGTVSNGENRGFGWWAGLKEIRFQKGKVDTRIGRLVGPRFVDPSFWRIEYYVIIIEFSRYLIHSSVWQFQYRHKNSYGDESFCFQVFGQSTPRKFNF